MINKEISFTLKKRNQDHFRKLANKKRNINPPLCFPCFQFRTIIITHGSQITTKRKTKLKPAFNYNKTTTTKHLSNSVLNPTPNLFITTTALRQIPQENFKQVTLA